MKNTTTNLLIIVILFLTILLSFIYNIREGMEIDRNLSIFNKDTKGRCIYHEDGVNNLNSDDKVMLSDIGSGPDVVAGYKRNCENQPNQVMCERTHAPDYTGEHVIRYCNWKYGGE